MVTKSLDDENVKVFILTWLTKFGHDWVDSTRYYSSGSFDDIRPRNFSDSVYFESRKADTGYIEMRLSDDAMKLIEKEIV